MRRSASSTKEAQSNKSDVRFGAPKLCWVQADARPEAQTQAGSLSNGCMGALDAWSLPLLPHVSEYMTRPAALRSPRPQVFQNHEALGCRIRDLVAYLGCRRARLCRHHCIGPAAVVRRNVKVVVRYVGTITSWV